MKTFCVETTFHTEDIVLEDFSFGGSTLCIKIANLSGRAVLETAASGVEVTFDSTGPNIADRWKTFDRSPAGDIARIVDVLSLE